MMGNLMSIQHPYVEIIDTFKVKNNNSGNYNGQDLPWGPGENIH